MSGLVSPSLAKAKPNASRVALPSFMAGLHSDDFQCFFRFFGSQRHAVVIRVVDHIADRIAFDRMGDDGAGLVLGSGDLAEGGEDFIQVVPVDLLREPAARFPTWFQRAEIEDFTGRASLLIAVLIDDRNEII